jgi:hypothetical protein
MQRAEETRKVKGANPKELPRGGGGAGTIESGGGAGGAGAEPDPVAF